MTLFAYLALSQDSGPAGLGRGDRRDPQSAQSDEPEERQDSGDWIDSSP
jgi:hypothetical protein